MLWLFPSNVPINVNSIVFPIGVHSVPDVNVPFVCLAPKSRSDIKYTIVSSVIVISLSLYPSSATNVFCSSVNVFALFTKSAKNFI